MLLSILDLEKVLVDDVMVPHNEIIGIDLDDDIEEISELIRGSEHTMLPWPPTMQKQNREPMTD